MRNGVLLSAILTLSAMPALADLTAEDVLAAQLNLLSGYGAAEAETTATTTRPDGLSVEGYVIRVEDEDGAEVTVRLGGLELVELGDGSVRIDYPERFPVSVATDEPDAELEAMSMELLLTDMSHVVSGDPEDVRNAVSFSRLELGAIETVPSSQLPDALDYAYVIENLSAVLRLAQDAPVRNELDLDMESFLIRMVLDEEADGALEGLDQLDAEVRIEGLSVRSDYVGTDLPEHRFDMALSLLDWRQTMSGEGMDEMDMTIGAEDFTLAWDVAVSFEAMDADMPAAMRSGMRIEGRTGYESMAYDISGISPDGDLQMAATAGATRGEVDFDRSGFTLFMESLENSATIAMPPVPDFPFRDISYRIARTLYDIDIPLLPGDERQPFHVRFAVNGVSVAEQMWSLIDPAGQIPRDPLDIEFDIDGTTIVDRDPFAEDQSHMPFTDSEVRLNRLRVAVGGAELTGTGEGRDTSEQGAPSGVGRIDLVLTGGNTLLETLIGMGLLTEEQAMPVRMGLSLIARPGDGPDTLTSTIEANEDGSITANGQRIK